MVKGIDLNLFNKLRGKKRNSIWI